MDTQLDSVKLGKYRHYKGKYYEVLGVATHTENNEKLVVYRYLYGDFGLSVRPLHMFQESVTINGVVTPRFALVEESLDAVCE